MAGEFLKYHFQRANNYSLCSVGVDNDQASSFLNNLYRSHLASTQAACWPYIETHFNVILNSKDMVSEVHDQQQHWKHIVAPQLIRSTGSR